MGWVGMDGTVVVEGWQVADGGERGEADDGGRGVAWRYMRVCVGDCAHRKLCRGYIVRLCSSPARIPGCIVCFGVVAVDNAPRIRGMGPALFLFPAILQSLEMPIKAAYLELPYVSFTSHLVVCVSAIPCC